MVHSLMAALQNLVQTVLFGRPTLSTVKVEPTGLNGQKRWKTFSWIFSD